MFSQVSNGRQKTVNERAFASFSPVQLIELYKILNKYTAENGEKSPAYGYLLSWTGLVKTNQCYATQAKKIIEDTLFKETFLELVVLDKKILEKQPYNYSLANEVYHAWRDLSHLLASMPTEAVTPFFGKGSETRKAISETVTHYQNQLIQNELPYLVDDEKMELTNIMKRL